jgi:hypothetical protein
LISRRLGRAARVATSTAKMPPLIPDSSIGLAQESESPRKHAHSREALYVKPPPSEDRREARFKGEIAVRRGQRSRSAFQLLLASTNNPITNQPIIDSIVLPCLTTACSGDPDTYALLTKNEVQRKTAGWKIADTPQYTIAPHEAVRGG